MGKIDVHAHFLPDFYRQALVETGHSKPDGMPAIPVCSNDMARNLKLTFAGMEC